MVDCNAATLQRMPPLMTLSPFLSSLGLSLLSRRLARFALTVPLVRAATFHYIKGGIRAKQRRHWHKAKKASA